MFSSRATPTSCPFPLLGAGEKLEAAGAIEGYVALINHKAIGLSNIVFVEVTLDKHDSKVLTDFEEALSRIPEVAEAFLVSGEHDFLIKVVVADTEHYERFLREKLYKISGIQNSRTTFGLRAVKQSTSVDPRAGGKPDRQRVASNTRFAPSGPLRGRRRVLSKAAQQAVDPMFFAVVVLRLGEGRVDSHGLVAAQSMVSSIKSGNRPSGNCRGREMESAIVRKPRNRDPAKTGGGLVGVSAGGGFA